MTVSSAPDVVNALHADTAGMDIGLLEELSPPLSREEALLEADRCLECGGPYAEAPCVTACPAGVEEIQRVVDDDWVALRRRCGL